MKSGTHLRRAGGLFLALAVTTLGLAGCSGDKGSGPAPADKTTATTKAPPADAHAAEVKAEREKLPPEDRALVDAQEWCAVSTDSRLGSMGPPLKLTVKDQPVFICCKGCQRKALADAEKTLAKVEELKAKARAERERK